MDNHLLNFTRQRVFPDEDVPLGSIEFLAVTAGAFLPWALALPSALTRAFRRPWGDATARLWLLFGLWAVCVIGFFTISPFKLPHYGLPAFPALALLVARVWDETIEGVPGAVSPRTLLTPLLLLFALVAAAFTAVWSGLVGMPAGALASVDVATRNLAAKGQSVPPWPLGAWLPILWRGALIFGLATVAMAVAVWHRATALGVGVALATTIAFLSAVAGEGHAQFVRTRAVRPVAQALIARAGPRDLVAHEGPIENSAAVLLALGRGVRVVNGLQSNLAFGATFPEARDVFWDAPRLQAAWAAPGRHYLVSTVAPEWSVVRSLPAGNVHVIAQSGGRWLYSNMMDR